FGRPRSPRLSLLNASRDTPAGMQTRTGSSRPVKLQKRFRSHLPAEQLYCDVWLVAVRLLTRLSWRALNLTERCSPRIRTIWRRWQATLTTWSSNTCSCPRAKRLEPRILGYTQSREEEQTTDDDHAAGWCGSGDG